MGLLTPLLPHIPHWMSVLFNGRVVVTSLLPHLGAPRMVTQYLRCADVCFNWSCRHQVGDVLLSLPPLVSKSAYAPVFSWHHLLSSLLQHLSAPRMVTQDSRCADVCFDWSCRHRVGDVLLSLPLLYPSQPTHPFS